MARSAIINLSGVLILDVALGAVRFRPPRIMRDLLVALAYIVIALYLLSASGVDLQGIVATSVRSIRTQSPTRIELSI